MNILLKKIMKSKINLKKIRDMLNKFNDNM